MNEPSGNNGRPLVSFAELVFMSNPIYILASQHCYIKVMVLDLAAARKVPDMIKQHHFFNRSMSLGARPAMRAPAVSSPHAAGVVECGSQGTAPAPPFATAAQFQGRAHAAACETHGAMCCDDSELCLKRFVNVNVSFGGQFGAHIHCKCVHASSHRDTSPLSSGFTPVPF